MDKKVFHTKKSTLFCFSSFKKTKKKKKKKKCPPSSSSSPLLLRPPTACTSATSRGRPPSRSYKRCSRTRRASRSQPCVSSWSSFVVAVVVFFLFLGWSLSFGGHKARFAEKSDDMMAIKIEIAPIHSMTKKTTMMDSRIQSSRRETRRHVAGPPSLSLDGRRRRKRRKSKVGGKGRHVSSRRWLLYHWWGNKKGPPWCELSPSSSLKVPKKRKKSP